MSIGEAHRAGNAGRPALLRWLTSEAAEPAPAAPSVPLRRAAGAILWAGGIAAVTAVLVQIVGAALPDVPYTWGEFGATAGWHVGYVVRFLLAAVLLRRLPGNAAAAWFAVLTGVELAGELTSTLLSALLAVGADAGPLAWTMLVDSVFFAASSVVALQLFVRLPAGGVEDALARWARAAWAFVALQPLAFAAHAILPIPWYAGGGGAVPNPLQLPFPVTVTTALTTIGSAPGALYAIGVGVVVVRYLRSGTATRRRLRWMLGVPVVVVASFATVVLFPDLPVGVVSVVAAASVVAVPLFTALAILGPGGVDVDDVLRRSLVYGVMWVAIAGLYVAAGAAVGTAAGARLPAFGAAVLTVVATLAFQPGRRWLERLADRWVFGNRADPAHLIAGLGATLEETYDVDELLPIIEDTLRRGLSVEWARVRLDGDHDGSPSDPVGRTTEAVGAAEAALRVPIVRGEEVLGVLECGHRRGRPLGADDAAVVRTFARQAALAIANVQLTSELTSKAEQLTASRARLVRAQETERRRIERNIHDGVQQELVTLIQHTGEIEQRYATGIPVGEELVTLRAELTGLLTTLRELAAGIHPSILTDRGLLPAVEALAGRHPVPVSVRVDRTLRGRRFTEEVEGAAYFTVAESLANSLKHAAASSVEVRLGRTGEALLLEIEDDGVGFAPADVDGGTGLVSLRARLEALGGDLVVDARPTDGTTVTATLALVDVQGLPR